MKEGRKEGRKKIDDSGLSCVNGCEIWSLTLGGGDKDRVWVQMNLF
jgi:hypothetical protein